MKKPIRMEDFEKMEKVEFPQKFMQRTITITKKKEMNISGLFLQQLRADGEQLFLDLRKSQDSRILAFRTVSDDGFEIPKSGKIKHIKFFYINVMLFTPCLIRQPRGSALPDHIQPVLKFYLLIRG